MTTTDAIALYRREKDAWIARTEPERQRVAAVVREILTRGGDGLAPLNVGKNEPSYYQQNKPQMIAYAKARQNRRKKQLAKSNLPAA